MSTPSDLAWRIAVEMEIYAAVGSTTEEKAEAIQKQLDGYSDPVVNALSEISAEISAEKEHH